MPGKLAKFPSAFREAIGTEEQVAIPYDRKKYVVGEKALEHHAFAEWLNDVNELIELYPLFIEFVEREYNTKVGGISVPLEMWEQFKSNGTKAPVFKKLTEMIKESEYSLKAYPQGLVVLRYLKDTGKVKGNVFLILDGGFKTLNTSITDGKKIYMVKSFYDELGLKTLVTKIFREEVKKVYPEITSNHILLNRYFVQEQIPVGFKSINVRKEKMKALKMFTEHMIKRIKKELSKVSVNYDGIIVTGGLSHYVDERWFNTNKELYITKEEGEFANVIAMHHFRKTTVLDLGFGDAKVFIDKDVQPIFATQNREETG